MLLYGFLTCVFLLLPMLFWSYIFTRFFPYGVSRILFFLWVLAGGIMSLPLIFQGNISWISQGIYSLFSALETGKILLLTYLAFLIIACFLWAYIFSRIRGKKYHFSLSFWRHIYIGVLLLIVFILGIFLSHILSSTDSTRSIVFSGIVFWGFASISAYYLLIAFLEELLKYSWSAAFADFQSQRVLERALSVSACIALGFAFFENGTYVFHQFLSGSTGKDLAMLAGMRGIFSMTLHLVSSLLLTLGVWKFLQSSWTVRIVWVCFFLFCSSIFWHALFDIALTYERVGIIFFYVLGAYFLISYLSLPRQERWPASI